MKHARIFVALFAVALLAASFATPGTVSAATPDQQWFENITWPVCINMGFSWYCSGSYGYEGMKLQSNKTWTSSSGYSGTWTVNRATKTLCMQFGPGQGCEPLYCLTLVSPGHGEGTMHCTVGSGDGCCTGDGMTCNFAPTHGTTDGNGRTAATP